jgi:hypothetical protein
VSDHSVEPSKGQMKRRIAMRFLRRIGFGLVALAGLLWFVAGYEDINCQRGIESSKVNGLSSIADRSFNPQMLRKGVALQMRLDQAAVARQGTLIARTVSLNVWVRNFAGAQSSVDQIVKVHAGYMAAMTISSPKDASHSLSSNIAIPTAQGDAALDELRKLGRVEEERQSTEEVSSQSEDLDIRLKNARQAEKRLSDILRMGTGKVSDVLEVEKEMARVREEIERMESEQKHLNNRVAFTAIDLNLTEEFQARLGGGSPLLGLRVRNALASGYHSAEGGLLDAFVFLLSVGPSLIIWTLILFWPARWAWRRWRKSQEMA